MIKTEERNPKTEHIDRMDTLSQLRLMNEENKNAVDAVQAALPDVARAVDNIVRAFGAGGRLFYIGAGTSGRIGVLDASECPPTFGTDPRQIVGIIAGGDVALRTAVEGAEDDPNAGVRDLKRHGLCRRDVIVGISAAGGADYVVKAVEYAKTLGCVTVGLTSNPGSPLANAADVAIVTDTGAEVVTGSTRLKAGSAQKMVLNMLTTASLIQCGYVYENMMVNLKPTNRKLKARMVRIVQEILSCSEAEATAELDKTNWKIPPIVIAHQSRNK